VRGGDAEFKLADPFLQFPSQGLAALFDFAVEFFLQPDDFRRQLAHSRRHRSTGSSLGRGVLQDSQPCALTRR
jgi:hypothetical protein